MSVLTDIADFLFPRFCVMCGERIASQEKGCVCSVCLMNLPRTGYHLLEHSPLEKLCWGVVPVERAVSFFYYSTSEVKDGIRSLKYFGKPDVALHLARIYADELRLESSFFDGVTAIIPVPLHWMRSMGRGYNQSDCIARGISEVTGIPVRKDIVGRKRNNVSQTKVRRTERRTNVAGVFKLKKRSLKDCGLESVEMPHFLIVDDVATTGSTLISCAQELMKLGDIRVSLLTLAAAGGRTPVPAAENDAPDTSVFGIPLIE